MKQVKGVQNIVGRIKQDLGSDKLSSLQFALNNTFASLNDEIEYVLSDTGEKKTKNKVMFDISKL